MQLNEDFILELLKGCLSNKHLMELCFSVLKEEYLPDKNYSVLWKAIKGRYKKLGKLPTVGALKVDLWKEEGAKNLLDNIREVESPEEEVMLSSLEEFIRRAKSVSAYVEWGDLYNSGKREEAFQNWVKHAEFLRDFSLQNLSYARVFGDFNRRYIQRIAKTSVRKKFPVGIDEIDDVLDGGPESTETLLLLGESGVGKSIALVGAGIACARLGGRVVHIQLEGTEDQCLNRYDSAFLGSEYRDVKFAEVDNLTLKKARKVLTDMRGEIYVKAFEKFYTCNTLDVRNFMREIVRQFGTIDRLVLDMLDLCDPDPRYGAAFKPSEERFRQSKVARECKEIAMEFNCDVVTATYANTIDINEKNNPNFYLTRWNLSEDKGKIRPFDVFITINQTHDEYQEQLSRLFVDKAREHKANQKIPIAQNLGRTRFFDRKRTLELFSEETSEE